MEHVMNKKIYNEMIDGINILKDVNDCYLDFLNFVEEFYTDLPKLIKAIGAYDYGGLSYVEPEQYPKFTLEEWTELNKILKKQQLKIKHLKEYFVNLKNEDTSKYFNNVIGDFLHTPEYSHYTEKINEATRQRFIQLLQKPKMFDIEKEIDNSVTYFLEMLSHINKYIEEMRLLFNRVDFICEIKDYDNNLVLIGANGSGKTTLANTLRESCNSEFISILSSQHLLLLDEDPYFRIESDPYYKVVAYQQNNISYEYDEDIDTSISEEFNTLISALINGHYECAKAFYESKGSKKHKKSELLEVNELWHHFFKSKEIIIDTSNLSVKDISTDSIYAFNNLSDGEKATFYYLSNIILAKKDSILITDEPENHLNGSLCKELWDKLEQIRSDLHFIYLTHDLDFASSRKNATIIWNQRYSPKTKWKFEVLPDSKIIPERMVMEIVGSPKDIIFCEGTNESLDYLTYSMLFPKYSIIPVGGHKEVVNYTKACNKASRVFKTNAFGIIDGDFHLESQIKAWEKECIITIDVNEIENLLCDDLILIKATNEFHSEKNSIDEFKTAIFKHLYDKKETIAMEYVCAYVNETITGVMVERKDNVDSLYNDIMKNFNKNILAKLFNERQVLIDNIVQNKDYPAALRVMSFKTIVINHFTKKYIVNNYKSRVISLLNEYKGLRDNLKKKYFKLIK